MQICKVALWEAFLVLIVVMTCGCVCWIGAHEKRLAPSVPLQPISNNYDDGYLAGVLNAQRKKEETK
jgi:hypothetical protein